MWLVALTTLGLLALGDAACSYHEKLAADEAAAHTSPDCLALGACQRLPEKLRKLCDARQPAMLARCAAGDTAGARHEVVNARNALEDHAGLLAAYRRTGQISGALFFDNVGAVVVDAAAFPSLATARSHLWDIAAGLGVTQATIADRGLSILGALYRLESLDSPCE